MSDSSLRNEQITRYLQTGLSDPIPRGWGNDLYSSLQQSDSDFKIALIQEVDRRANGKFEFPVPSNDLIAFTRSRIEPMVNGLFPGIERENVISVLEKSVVFITRQNISSLIQSSGRSTAWNLANLYLRGLSAECLNKSASGFVGLCENTTCFVSTKYFADDEKFADYVVHEAAHVFHSCKRRAIGLPETRSKEFLLNIEFCERETFAYACEAFSCILRLARNAAQRKELLDELRGSGSLPPDESVNLDKYWTSLEQAVQARNGWKKILEICAPQRHHQRLLLGE